MPRGPRIHDPGGFSHVILRGNNTERIFFDHGYYLHFCRLLQEGVHRFGHRIHAYCLIPNHFHLAVQVSNIPLSTIVHNASFRYAQWVNARRDRRGHLFQGRFKSVPVKTDGQLLELIRYIHLNPVRAGIVNDPAEYRWSSHRIYLGRGATGAWLTTDTILSMFGNERAEARRRYERFVVMNPIKEGFVEALDADGDELSILEQDTSLSDCTDPTDQPGIKLTLEDLVLRVCREYELSEEVLGFQRYTRHIAEARGALAWLAKELKTATRAEVAIYLNRDPSTLSVAARRFEERCRSCAEGQEKLERLLGET